jgi:hypothetical protein
MGRAIRGRLSRWQRARFVRARPLGIEPAGRTRVRQLMPNGRARTKRARCPPSHSGDNVRPAL